jgi:glutathione S-transferase
MPELILHHYDMSPYAEKIRIVMGLKRLAWRSVQIAVVMPKPDLTELTGGYRRTPTLQIGADLYCDTKAITRVLDRLYPDPPLFPSGEDATALGISMLAEKSFMMGVTVFLGLQFFPEDFVHDRRLMVPDVDIDKAPMLLQTKLLQLRANLDRFERQLADGRRFLLGDSPCIADLSGYHPHRFLSSHPVTASFLTELTHVPAWIERIAEIGHGQRTELDSAGAIDIAKAAEPAAPPPDPVTLPKGLAYGDSVVIVPEEPGSGNVSGTLVGSDLHEIAIARESERAGSLVVHFPRDEYLVLKTG